MTHRVYAQLRDAARALYLARKNHIEQATRGDFKRPPEWFAEQRGVIREIELIGLELRFIADHAEAYESWKAAVARRPGAAA
jgi:hypothetical protein